MVSGQWSTGGAPPELGGIGYSVSRVVGRAQSDGPTRSTGSVGLLVLCTVLSCPVLCTQYV